MSPRAPASFALALSFLCVAATAALTGQAPQAMVGEARLTADTIEIGDLFDLTFEVSLPSGGILFMPDSITAANFEPFGRVEWTVAEISDGGARLSVVYPLIAFQIGTVEIPDFDVFTALQSESESAGFSSSGDVVGDWESFRSEPAAVPSARIQGIAEQRLYVNSVLVMDDLTEGLTPRPAADVSGGDRHWPATLLLLGFTASLLGVAGTTVREVLANRRANVEVFTVDPRTHALSELDALLQEAPHLAGRTQSFYERSSEIVRRYVEAFDDVWNPAWTSTELMTDLDQRRADLDGSDLSPEMTAAEMVKFAGDRPDAESAESHWQRVRSWVAGSEGPP